jgi:hypothetical protein
MKIIYGKNKRVKIKKDNIFYVYIITDIDVYMYSYTFYNNSLTIPPKPLNPSINFYKEYYARKTHGIQESL